MQVDLEPSRRATCEAENTLGGRMRRRETRKWSPPVAVELADPPGWKRSVVGVLAAETGCGIGGTRDNVGSLPGCFVSFRGATGFVGTA